MNINENIIRTINDFDRIRAAIIEKGIAMPNKTPSSLYADKIREMKTDLTNDTLPPQITDFTAISMNEKILLTFTEVPVEQQPYLKQYNFVYKQGSIPLSVNDGIMISVDKQGGEISRSVYINGLASSKLYYIRSYPSNYKDQYQTVMSDAVIAVTIPARVPGTRNVLTALTKNRTQATSSTFITGGVGVFGGIASSAIGEVEYYTEAKVKSTLTALTTARYALTSNTFVTGGIGVFGGCPTTTSITAMVDYYNESRVKSTLTSLSAARSNCPSAAFNTGGIAIFGGYLTSSTTNIVDYYNESKVRSTLTALATSSFMNRTASTFITGGVGVFGGSSSSNINAEYYTEDKVRSTLSVLSSARMHSATFTNGGIGLFGGAGSMNNTTDYYNENKVKSILATLSVSRYGVTCCAFNTGGSGIGVFGGTVSSSNYSNVVDYYNEDKVRSTLTALSTARGSAVSSSFNTGGVAVIGGSGVSNVVDFYPIG